MARKKTLTTIRLGAETRKGLAFIVKVSAAATTNIAVIRGMTRRFSELLKKQLDAEKEGGCLLLVEQDASGVNKTPVIRLDLRL